MNYHRILLAVAVFELTGALWQHNLSAFVGFALVAALCLELLRGPLYASQHSAPAGPQTSPQRQETPGPACCGCGGPVITGDETVRRRCNACGPLPLDYIAYEPHP